MTFASVNIRTRRTPNDQEFIVKTSRRFAGRARLEAL
jgi:hypothetical protein